MATILEFPCEGRLRHDVRAEGGTLGEIIIFPGVRIERCNVDEMHKDDRALAKKRAQRGRKKKA
jgi:hypothetical protein